MNKLKVYLVTVNSNIEFRDGSFSGWNEKPSVLYGFYDLEKAQKRIWELRQIEVATYRQWLKKENCERECYMHNHYDTKTIMVF